jgi:hypothetical protein
MIGIIESPGDLLSWASVENRATEAPSETIHDFLKGRDIQSTDHCGRKALLGTLVEFTTSFG